MRKNPLLEYSESLAQKIDLLCKAIKGNANIIFQIKNDMEEFSAKQDKLNKIETAVDIIGVEKTGDLLDNYHEELKLLLKNIPNNDYKIRLEGLINNYVR